MGSWHGQNVETLYSIPCQSQEYIVKLYAELVVHREALLADVSRSSYRAKANAGS